MRRPYREIAPFVSPFSAEADPGVTLRDSLNRRWMRVAAALVISIVLVACRADEPDLPTPTPGTAESSQPNLLSLARGAAVTTRTGELRLDASALHAIDDDPATSWTTPPRDPAHMMVIALPARSMIEQVGVTIARDEAPGSVLFERSVDGQTFTPLGTVQLIDPSRPEFLNVPPSEASSLRVTIQEGTEKTVAIASLYASGTETAEYIPPVFEGSWQINGRDARFVQEGIRIRGDVAAEPPIHIDGAWIERSFRFLYMRGNEYGFGALVVSPDGRSLNGMTWYHKITPIHAAPAWFGEKTGDESSGPGDHQVMDRWLERSGSVPLFGIVFDTEGDIRPEASEQSLRWLVSRISRSGSGSLSLIRRILEPAAADSVRGTATRQLDSLRSELVRRGVDVARVRFDVVGPDDLEQVPQKRLEREMLTSVELRLSPAKDVAR